MKSTFAWPAARAAMFSFCSTSSLEKSFQLMMLVIIIIDNNYVIIIKIMIIIMIITIKIMMFHILYEITPFRLIENYDNTHENADLI